MQIQRTAISEIVVVEGLHDKQAIDQVAVADVWVVGGDRVATRFLSELKRASAHRGVIVFTDPDGPGERIRARIERAVPDCRHAFLTRAKAQGNHKIGVEHAQPQDILEALVKARPSVEHAETKPSADIFTLTDLQTAGLIGLHDSANRRRVVADILRIGYGNGKAFLRKLNALCISREEWTQAVSQALLKESLRDTEQGRE